MGSIFNSFSGVATGVVDIVSSLHRGCFGVAKHVQFILSPGLALASTVIIMKYDHEVSLSAGAYQPAAILLPFAGTLVDLRWFAVSVADYGVGFMGFRCSHFHAYTRLGKWTCLCDAYMVHVLPVTCLQCTFLLACAVLVPDLKGCPLAEVYEHVNVGREKRRHERGEGKARAFRGHENKTIKEK
jgi:hypothetical protein